MTLGFLRALVPVDRKFFPLFEKAAFNLEEGGRAIHTLAISSKNSDRSKLLLEIERIEHAGDDITHEIFNELGKNFITPFDREDIHRLITSIDDILDFIHGAAKRIELYKINQFNVEIIKLAELIKISTEELRYAIIELKSLKKAKQIGEALVRINSIENDADEIFDKAVSELFEKEKDAINLFKMKEVYSALETATDKCEDAANVIDSIIVKMS